ncbi:MAG: hypothetical protein ABJ275_10740 [Maricaulaceae bacterium]
MASNFDNWIGKTDDQKDVVTPALIERYSAVIGAKSLEGIAPKGLHWCLCLPDAPMAELGEDGHPKTGGFLPPSPLPRRMWASSKVEFLADIKANAPIKRRSKIASVSEKTGRSGSLLFVNVDHVTSLNDIMAVKETQTIVYRDAPKEKMILPQTGEVDLSAWDKSERLTPNTALLFRYSALTFNTHRIHYDHHYATQAEGYPALVVHGPLMASLLLRFANEHASGRKIHKFEFRGLAPAFCNQKLFLAANDIEGGLDLAVIGADGQKRMAANVSFKI